MEFKMSDVQPEQQSKRIYKGEQEVDHDLFVLEDATMQKDVSWDHSGIYENVTHKHFFHTFDSNGKKHTYAVPIAGHTHEVEWSEDQDGNLTAKCGPAIRVRKSKKYPMFPKDNNGNYKCHREAPERANHVHEVKYKRSERLKLRKFSDDAAQAMQGRLAEQAKLAKNPAQ